MPVTQSLYKHSVTYTGRLVQRVSLVGKNQQYDNICQLNYLQGVHRGDRVLLAQTVYTSQEQVVNVWLQNRSTLEYIK